METNSKSTLDRPLSHIPHHPFPTQFTLIWLLIHTVFEGTYTFIAKIAIARCLQNIGEKRKYMHQEGDCKVALDPLQ